MKNFLKIIKEEVRFFDDKFKEHLSTNTSLLHKISTYLRKKPGKKIRPICVILSAGLLNNITDQTYRGAILIELLHTATLIHDDIVDDAQLRRSTFSINTIWKNKIAVLTGDYFLAKGLKIAVANKDFQFLELISGVVEKIVQGELFQIEKTKKLNLTEKDYFKIVKLKTASLFETAFTIGAISASGETGKIEKLSELGLKIGVIFQMKDDVLDYDNNQYTGKSVGNDIKEGKINLPLLYALQKMDFLEKNQVHRILRKKKNTKSEIIMVQKLVIKYHGIKKTELKIQKYIEDVQLLIRDFTASNYKQSVVLLLDFLINRRR